MDKKQTIRYFALVQALYYAATGLWNYLNIYLREIGFSARQLGNVSAVGILAAMAVLPVMGILADKIRSPKKLFTWFLAMMLPLLLLYPAMDLAGVRWLMPYMVLTVAMVILAPMKEPEMICAPCLTLRGIKPIFHTSLVVLTPITAKSMVPPGRPDR